MTVDGAASRCGALPNWVPDCAIVVAVAALAASRSIVTACRSSVVDGAICAAYLGNIPLAVSTGMMSVSSSQRSPAPTSHAVASGLMRMLNTLRTAVSVSPGRNMNASSRVSTSCSFSST